MLIKVSVDIRRPLCEEKQIDLDKCALRNEQFVTGLRKSSH